MDLYEPLKHCEPVQMGYMASHAWRTDPKRLGFTAARYKFAAKMLEGCSRVLEVGCADGFFADIVRQHVGEVVITDLDGAGQKHDFLQGAYLGGFDGGYCLDVLEHIPRSLEDRFIAHVYASVKGPMVWGMPSLESQRNASELSLRGHVNCKDKEGLRETLLRHYSHAFLFGMNDETIHTGISANYWLALCLR